MLGSPHTRTSPSPSPTPSRAGFGSVGLMRLLQQTRLCLFAMNRNRHDPSKLHDCTEQVYIKTTLSLIEIFIHFISFVDFCTQFGFDSQHRKYFLLLGDHFILGDKLPLFSKHHCEGNTCLKEIVSNTRLGL